MKGKETSNVINQNSLKILYALSTNLTLSIIKRANRTFETAGDIIALADEVANCSKFFLETFEPGQLTVVAEVSSIADLVGPLYNIFQALTLSCFIHLTSFLTVCSGCARSLRTEKVV